MSRPLWAYIDRQALKHNLRRVRQFAPDSRVMAVIKANAYGLGIPEVLNSLSEADAFAVASVEEGVALRTLVADKPIIVLSSFSSEDETGLLLDNRLSPVIHHFSQLSLLSKIPQDRVLSVWLKLESGMHRLGLSTAESGTIIRQLEKTPGVSISGLMSHLANSHDRDSDYTVRQIVRFNQLTRDYLFRKSLANSGGICCWPESHYDWVRPGIMLYGASPVSGVLASELGLKTVVSFRSRVIAVKHLQKGDAVGYGSIYTCPENMPVGIVPCGYGDGFPRCANENTPVMVDGKMTRILGRVSMDSLLVDLRACSQRPGADIEFWGKRVAIEHVAESCGTIAYELLCRMTARVPRVLVDGQN